MKFVITSILFVAGVAALRFSLGNSSILIPWLIAIFLLYITIIAAASLSFRWNFFLHAIHKGTPGKIVITFDDGPHPQTTSAILETLHQYHAPAAFFLIGHKAASHPEIVKKITDSGHEVGNHSYHHSNLHGFLSTSSVMQEIEKTNSILQELTGKSPRYYRPPFGVTNPNIAQAVRKTRMKSIGWDLRSFDTFISDRNRLLNRIKNRIPSSTILLLHDTMPVTASILPEILDFCKNNGIEIVSLSEALKTTR